MKTGTYKVIAILFVGLLLGVSMVSGVRAWRQERLRQDLVAAVQKKDTLAALRLLDQGANANATEADKTIPDWLTLLKRLFSKSPSPSSQPSVLTLAARTPDCVLMTALIQHGANVNCHDPDCAHSTPLFRIMDRCNFSGDWDFSFEDFKAARIAVAHLLLDHGADPNLRGRDNAMPLDNAWRLDDAGLVRHLLDCGANLQGGKRDGMRPWDMVIYEDNTEILNAFLDKGLAVNATEQEDEWSEERTLLDFAAYRGATKCVGLLLKRGADAHHRNKDGWTPLMHTACYHPWDRDLLPTARLLLQHGVDINAKDHNGNSALMKAISHYQRALALFLLKHGADVRSCNKNGDTALILAADQDEVKRAILQAAARK